MRKKKKNLPKKPRSSRDRVCPDGVLIEIDWESFEPGTSIFIPAVNLNVLRSQMAVLLHKKGIRIKSAERIEGGLLGMRYWRVA